MEILKNDKLTVEISSHGAELQSIKNAEGHEYLWQGDEKYWPRRSPLLFPIVCGLWKDEYRVDGKTYSLPRHGFARDMDFEVLNKTETTVTYGLDANDETMKVYPYDFHLNVRYVLKDDTLNVFWVVKNVGKEEMHFQVGGHPAFNLPDVAEGDKMHGRILFDNEKPLTRIIGNTGGCIKPERYEVKTEHHAWKFDEESFADDAVILDKSQVGMTILLDDNGNPKVGLSFDAPCVGIWSPYGKNAPFVCIEPWFGIHDWAEYDGEFKDKYLMNHLQPGAVFMGNYEIKIF
ncbi:MAG: aldose 1-epimerase family protein [Prevotella sp.]|nr:aldose 1-epimerase family protein [Prevotella sp.]